MFKKTFKTIAVTSSLVMMFGIAKPISVEAATFSATTTASVNVRTGASTKYRVIGTMKKGKKVKVLSSSRGWYKVQYSGSKTGWSSAKYIKKGSSSSSSSSSSTSKSTNATVTSNVNVRKGASTKHRSLGILRRGTKVKILSSSNGWYKVKYSGNKTGWSSAKYIKKGSSSSSSSNSSNKVKKRLKVKAYAYTGGGYTATGTKAKYGTLAVDPRIIPYGTKIYIKELNKVFTAEDCGGGIKGNKVDIYMNSESACRKWGVRTITLEILK